MYEHIMKSSYTAFAGVEQIAKGSLEDVTQAAKAAYDAGRARLLIFDDFTGRQVDLDLRASEVPSRPRARGRPRLGVTAREVTLLPRHWEWLSEQPGGASAALRRLVDQAQNSTPALAEKNRAAIYRIMLALAGDLPRYEQANRALFSNDLATAEAIATTWPSDISGYICDQIHRLRSISKAL